MSGMFVAPNFDSGRGVKVQKHTFKGSSQYEQSTLVKT